MTPLTDLSADELRALIATLTDLLDQARRAVVLVPEQSAAEERAFREGYFLGFGAGAEVGQAREQAAEERRAAAQAELIARFSTLPTHEKLEQMRFPGHTCQQIQRLRGRDRYPLPDRVCSRCDGRGILPGGVV